jgi:hypothetical protein
MIDLGKTNQSPAISAPDTAGNGQSHGGSVADTMSRVSAER